MDGHWDTALPIESSELLYFFENIARWDSSDLRWRTEARARRYPKQYWRSSTQRQSLISRIVDRKRIRLQKVPILLS
jgi:hypothetical protein